MATRDEIRDGSVVRLTGCSQEMVVKRVVVDLVECMWLDFDHKMNCFKFPLSYLERVSW